MEPAPRGRPATEPFTLGDMGDIRFLNVDLDVESRTSLKPLIDDLGEDVIVLHEGQSRGLYEAHFETAECGGDAESTLATFCVLLENLDTEAAEVWKTAVSRTFDIGFDSGDSPCDFRAIIHPDTVQRVAELNAAIIITIYPRPDEVA